jgi:hypothetical protein
MFMENVTNSIAYVYRSRTGCRGPRCRRAGLQAWDSGIEVLDAVEPAYRAVKAV